MISMIWAHAHSHTVPDSCSWWAYPMHLFLNDEPRRRSQAIDQRLLYSRGGSNRIGMRYHISSQGSGSYADSALEIHTSDLHIGNYNTLGYIVHGTFSHPQNAVASSLWTRYQFHTTPVLGKAIPSPFLSGGMVNSSIMKTFSHCDRSVSETRTLQSSSDERELLCRVPCPSQRTRAEDAFEEFVLGFRCGLWRREIVLWVEVSNQRKDSY